MRFVRNASCREPVEMSDLRRSGPRSQMGDPSPTASGIGWVGWLALFGVFALAILLVTYL